MFIVCGEALYDLFASDGPQGLSFDARIGGSPFNVAVGLARLGQASGLMTGMSTDNLGRRLRAALEDEGVSTAYLAAKERPTTLSLVDVGPDGGPAYVFYGTGAADRSLEPGDVAAMGPEVWGLHFGSYALVADPTGATLLGLAQGAKGKRFITLDPNVRLNVEPDLDVWRARVDAFAATADLVKVSDEDLARLYPGEPVEHSARRWLDAGAAVVIVTMGAEGARGFTHAVSARVPGVRVAIADTVGAGDTFQAALIANLAETGRATRPMLQALTAEALSGLMAFAAQAAAITCARRGADLPRRRELPAL